MSLQNKHKPSQIAKLIEYAKADVTNTHQEINFGNVPNFQAQEINFKTGIKVNGAIKVISSSGIIHTIKRHGNDKEETARGQKRNYGCRLRIDSFYFSQSGRDKQRHCY
jgi:phage-Barnase-EndoU-ColicinE5/D-RelE like nuclease3